MTDKWWWEPLALDDAVALMDGFRGPWWVAGGWAIDLLTGRQTREHEDVDLLVLRRDQGLLRRQLPGWDLQVAHGGRLEPWWGELLVPPRSGLWARTDRSGPWLVQFLLADHTGGDWVYKHDPSLRLPLAAIGLRSAEGVPFLRPEVVLLFKSRRPRERDEHDVRAVLPHLDAGARDRLRAWLPAGHAWRAVL